MSVWIMSQNQQVMVKANSLWIHEVGNKYTLYASVDSSGHHPVGLFDTLDEALTELKNIKTFTGGFEVVYEVKEK